MLLFSKKQKLKKCQELIFQIKQELTPTIKDENIKINMFNSLLLRFSNATLDLKVNEAKMKANLYTMKIAGHKRTVLKHNKSIIIYAVVEVIVMCIVFICQWYYMRKLVEKL